LKTGINSVLCAIITNAAICACFVPFLLLGSKKVRQVNTFWLVGIYWFLNGLVNLRALPLIRSEVLRGWLLRLSDYYDLMDIPLALSIYAMAAGTRKLRKQLLLVLLGYVAGETLLIRLKGYVFSWPVVIGVGVLLILVYSIMGLWQYLKKMEHDRLENCMAFVHGAFLFAYGTYGIIYLLFYLRASATFYNQTDSSLLYYTSLLLSAVVTGIGIWGYGWRGSGRTLPTRYSSSSS
jgi:hypothetical protein